MMVTLQEYIDKVLLSRVYDAEQMNRADDQRFWHISDAGRCHRMRWLKRKGYTRDIPSNRVLRVLSMGTAAHSLYEKLCYDADIVVASGKDLRVETEDIHGEADVVVKLPEGNVLYDWKTVHSNVFHWVVKKGKEHLHYVYQLLNYFILLKEKFSLVSARLMYLSKDDLETLEKEYLLTDDWQQKIDQDWMTLRHYWVKNECPPVLPDYPNNWECERCWYKTSCERIEADKK